MTLIATGLSPCGRAEIGKVIRKISERRAFCQQEGEGVIFEHCLHAVLSHVLWNFVHNALSTGDKIGLLPLWGCPCFLSGRSMGGHSVADSSSEPESMSKEVDGSLGGHAMATKTRNLLRPTVAPSSMQMPTAPGRCRLCKEAAQLRDRKPGRPTWETRVRAYKSHAPRGRCARNGCCCQGSEPT